MSKVILSIAIPTYNRGNWLKLCLEQLLPQVVAVGPSVDVTVYDNASPDNTANVVQAFIDCGLPLKYLRNDVNIGSDRNIAQCFNFAKGRYVLILGDDDVILDGALQKIVNLLQSGDFGAVFLNAYGYDSDFINEQPSQFSPRLKVYSDANAFIKKCFIKATFISSLIINKSSCANLDANKFVGTSLVQSFLFYEAVFSRSANLYVDEYMLAARRTEQKDYDVIRIFCGQFNCVLETFIGRGLLPASIASINRKLLWYFLPFHLLLLRSDIVLKDRITETYSALYSRYYREPLFWLCSAPILKFPASLARLWAYSLIVLGRLLNGESGRLWIAIKEKINRMGKI